MLTSAKPKNFETPRPTRQRLPALQTFETVARHLSVTKAAAELFVTPGAVSRQVRLLEESLGFDLFVRHHRSMTLTVQGEKLAECLTACFDRVDRALMELMREKSGKRLRLRVMPSFAIRWLVPRLPSFHGAFPEIELEISTVSVDDDASLDNIDFAVRLGSGNWDDAQSLHLFDDALVPVCIPSIAEKLRVPGDLANQTLLHSMVRPEGWEVWISGQGMQSHQFVNNMRFANAALACQAALDGLGVVVIQREYVELELQTGRLVAPFPPVGRLNIAYYLVWSPRNATSSDLLSFINWIKTVCTPRKQKQRRQATNVL